VTLKSDGHEVKAGNEVVMFRHEKTFYNKRECSSGGDDQPLDAIKAKVKAACVTRWPMSAWT